MKKVFALVLTLSVLAAVAAPTFAQSRSRPSCDSTYSQTYSTRQSARTYDYDLARARTSDDSSRIYYDFDYRDRSFWDKHRDKLTLAIGAGAGAAIGAWSAATAARLLERRAGWVVPLYLTRSAIVGIVTKREV